MQDSFVRADLDATARALAKLHPVVGDSNALALLADYLPLPFARSEAAVCEGARTVTVPDELIRAAGTVLDRLSADGLEQDAVGHVQRFLQP
jgi:hypothetical protein